VTAAAGAIALVGLETCSGTGAVTAATGAIASAGLETYSGTATLTTPAGAITLTALETVAGTGDVTAAPGAIAGSDQIAAITGTGDCAALVGVIDAAGDVGATAVVVEAPIVWAGSGGSWRVTPIRRRRGPVAMHGHGSCGAPVGQITGRGQVSTVRIDLDEAYLLGLLALDEAA
jgi:hypothetical protein